MSYHIEELKKTIERNNSFIIVSHVDPEGDAIGTSLALYFALKNLGKRVCVYNESGVPKILRFLPGSSEILTEIESVNEFDCIFIVDCGDLGRIGVLKNKLEKLKIINIDHHNTNDNFGDINFVDKNASATGEVLFDLLKELKIPLTYEIAVNLYTAIVVDTGSFRYASTRPKSFQIAAELLNLGVDPWYVAMNVYENYPYERMKLLGEVLSTLTLHMNGKVAFMLVTQQMLKKYDASIDLTEGFVNFGRAIEGVELSIIFKETNNNGYKLSMRSKGNVDVSLIARSLGGGGHRNAAGCKVQGTYEEASKRVLEVLQEYEWNLASK
ncbi:MAG: bifunctional oligoribonuclease/PAP phosphatase NrnA [Proteobacteria bacterium]|nr:bifunctional oligoribonuclease/PAP phosphatase NrnA [Pseudomonadota bacterium]